MAKKPAPLTSDLLVRKGEATPSSIDPSDRATETAGTPEAPQVSTPPTAPAADNGRPQTPEPEIVLAADAEDEDGTGSRRRLAGLLALVAVVTAGVFAFNMFGPDSGAPSVAPVGGETDIATSGEQTVAPIVSVPGPASVGTPTPPGEPDLRLAPTEDAAPGEVEAAAPAPAAPVIEEPVIVATAPVTPPREAATITPPATSTPAEIVETPAPTPVPASKIASPGQYLVQLLSVRSESAARAAWGRIQATQSALLGDEVLNLETADLGERGTYYRVRFGAFDARTNANAVCKSLKEQGQDCLVKRIN